QFIAPDSPARAAGILPGDVVTEANGQAVSNVTDLQAALKGVKPGDKVELKYSRDGAAPASLTVGTEADPQDPNHAVMGISVVDDSDITLDPTVTYKTGNIGGPSAGLPFALAVYDALGDRNLTKGHRIAATGEMALDGTVGPIGGVEQKAVGAA